ncbi:polysaccharide deacetylase family protein [Nonomuraea sp. NPDC005983]|uniref:polysaccharide deacetylase family protein n=1 Tax=Nonomuraea sp. NPDC005983 TaxID=3155595 RepID=UPI0033BB602C
MIGRRGFLAIGGGLTLAACTPSIPEKPDASGRVNPSGTPVASGTARSATPLPRLPGEVPHGPRDRPLVALTFHGSGEPALAERALAAMEREHAHATVLAVGTWLDRAIADRITGAGHDLGNHTMHHLDISHLTADRAREEIEECAARLHDLTGSTGSWFRQSAAWHATPLIRTLARRAGYPTCLSYDVDSRDYLDPGERAITGNVLRAVRPGSIVSMHLGHAQTVAAIPRILDGLHRRGLRAVTATELLTRPADRHLDESQTPGTGRTP